MHRIPLSNAAFEGDNNVYCFDDGDPVTLVDTGDWLPATEEQLAAALAERGHTVADVDRILLTHWHMDHTGLAGTIQAESGAQVCVHEADAPLVAGDAAAWAAMRDRQDRYLDQWGMPASAQETLRERMVDVSEIGPAPTVTPFSAGETFAVAGGEVTVRHASGHAAGSCWFELDGQAATGGHADTATDGTEILSGDVLLPKYTPNVGGADVRVESPLAAYLDALGRIADADYGRAWPGHRDPIDDPTARAEAIVAHHEERAYRVLSTLADRGPCDAWTVSAALFGDLSGIHVLHGPGEAYAHLDHLARAGTVLEEGGTYRLADGVAEQLADRDSQRWSLAE